jgi:hypothetical protein
MKSVNGLVNSEGASQGAIFLTAKNVDRRLANIIRDFGCPFACHGHLKGRGLVRNYRDLKIKYRQSTYLCLKKHRQIVDRSTLRIAPCFGESLDGNVS